MVRRSAAARRASVSLGGSFLAPGAAQVLAAPHADAFGGEPVGEAFGSDGAAAAFGWWPPVRAGVVGHEPVRVAGVSAGSVVEPGRISGCGDGGDRFGAGCASAAGEAGGRAGC